MEIEKFLESYSKKIVAHPDAISVFSEIKFDEHNLQYKEITIFAHNDDVGRLVGKNGRMISSLKTIISGSKAKNGLSHRIVVKPV